MRLFEKQNDYNRNWDKEGNQFFSKMRSVEGYEKVIFDNKSTKT